VTLVWSPGFTQWDPAAITTALWLDAADASTVTETSGLITQVNDKSGNSRNFTASSGARPTYTSSGLNGLPVFTLSGSQYLTSADTAATWNFLHQAGGSTVWIAGKAGNVSNPLASSYLLGNNATSSTNHGMYFAYGDEDFGGGKNDDLITDFVTRGVTGSFVSFNVSTNNTLAANTAFQASVAWNLGSGTASARSSIRVNGGSAIELNAETNAASTSNASHTLQIGAAGNNAVPMTGFISEVVIAASIASTDTRQRIEGYLAHKWGLTANLPNDHPYRWMPPTLGV
jgi:hypothetical protein